MLPSLVAHPGIVVVAAADPNEAARERFVRSYGGTAYADLAAMLRDAAIDAVYIATPHQFHAEHALAAAAAGKHMIIEKPLALTVEDGQRIVDAARRAGVVTLVGHTAGFDPAVRHMRRLIASGELGALRMITSIAYTDFLYRPRRPEELDTRLGGGIMYNQVPHQIEIARVLTQAPVRSLRCATGVWDPRRPTEGAMSALVEFEGGTVAALTYSGYDHFDSDELCFWVGVGGSPKTPAHGSARRALGSIDEVVARTGRGFAGRGAGAAGPAYQPHFGMLLVSCERGDLRVSKEGVLVYDVDGAREITLPAGRASPNRDVVANDFHAAVVQGVPPLQDAAWGLQTVEIALALLRSSEERRELNLL
jgi:phthalate 4,5-cis-dihydrodiol dehydrogenase